MNLNEQWREHTTRIDGAAAGGPLTHLAKLAGALKVHMEGMACLAVHVHGHVLAHAWQFMCQDSIAQPHIGQHSRTPLDFGQHLHPEAITLQPMHAAWLLTDWQCWHAGMEEARQTTTFRQVVEHLTSAWDAALSWP